MKMRNLALMAIAGALFTSCDKKEDGGDSSANYKYALGYRVQVDADNTADYLLMAEDITSTAINADGKGIEQAGWCYFDALGSNVFSINYSTNICTGYEASSTGLTEKGSFVYERMDCMAHIEGNDDEFLAIGAPWGGGSYDCNLQIIDAITPSIAKSVKDPIYTVYWDETTRLNAWPTGAYVDGDKLLVPFYPLDGETWHTPFTDTAYISVFDYPSLSYVKTIKDIRTGPIGYYASQPCILEDEKGDHYFISSSSYAAGYTTKQSESGILKVNAGTTEFDDSYFYDVEAQSSYKVLTGTYVADGLAVVKVISSTIDDASGVGSWAGFSSTTPVLTVAVMDLYNKTLTHVTDIPMHGGQYKTPFLVEDGKVYLSANDGTEAFIWEVDPTTATATKGAEIEGNELQAIIKLP